MMSRAGKASVVDPRRGLPRTQLSGFVSRRPCWSIDVSRSCVAAPLRRDVTLLCRRRETRTSAAADINSDGGSSDAVPTVRINKCFRHFASRREADRFVVDGRVRVDGVVAEVGQQVSAGAEVTLDGRAVEWERLNLLHDGSDMHANSTQGRAGGVSAVAGEERFVYIKYWKPAGVVCTTDRRIEGNVISEIGHPERIFPVGRLDKETTGLLLLTSDGRVPNAVGRAGGRHLKTYWVRTEEAVSEEEMERLRRGVVITTTSQRERGGKTVTARTLECDVQRRPGGTAFEIQISIREGRNRQIRRMLAAIEHEVVALHRFGVMSVTLAGLKPGEWRDLDEEEMGALRKAISAGDTGPNVMESMEEFTEAELREAELSLRAASPAQWAERAAYERSQSEGRRGVGEGGQGVMGETKGKSGRS